MSKEESYPTMFVYLFILLSFAVGFAQKTQIQVKCAKISRPRDRLTITL